MSILPTLAKSPEDLIEQVRAIETHLILTKLKGEHERDGEGWRYLIPQAYLFAGSSFESVHAFERFQLDYPDDIGSPCLFMCSALAHYREGLIEQAEKLLYELIFSNIYFMPQLLSRNVQRKNIWHGIDIADVNYLEEVDPRVFSSWKTNEIKWATQVFDSKRYQFILQQFVAVRHELQHEHDISKRMYIGHKEAVLREL